jgi:hypothetical protein
VAAHAPATGSGVAAADDMAAACIAIARVTSRRLLELSETSPWLARMAPYRGGCGRHLSPLDRRSGVNRNTGL